MTRAFLALKDADEPFKIIRDHEYLFSDASALELDVDRLVQEQFLRELSDEEALKIYKGEA